MKCKRCGCQDIEFKAGDVIPIPDPLSGDGGVTCAPIDSVYAVGSWSVPKSARISPEKSQTEKDLSALKRHLVFGIIPQEPADSMARLILKLYEERLGYQRNPGL